MLKKNHKYLLFIFFFTLGICNFYGQITSEEIPLTTLLSEAEQKFEIRFTYAPDNIEGQYLIPPPKSFSLSETLNYFNKNTSLLFTQINNRFITVVLKNENHFLCGIIINEFTGELLEGASVSVIKGKYTTTTNAEGKFNIPTNLKDSKIKISYVGYKEIILPIASLEKNNCKQILIQLTIDELDQVFITNYFTKGIEKQFNGSTTIATKQFGLLPGQIENDVLQIIQVIPGVESVDETISNINIRGGTHDENLILWDDIKMYQNGHFFGLISAFNPDITKNVTVYKNGTPSRYGEGVSGVIDMKSKNSLTNKINGGAGFNLINASAFLSIPITENLGVQVSGRSSINQLFESSVYTSYADRIFQDTEITNVQSTTNNTLISSDEDFNFFDFSAKILWDFTEKDQLRINYLVMENSLDFTEVINETDQSKTSTLEQESVVGGISWKRNWSQKLETTAFAYGSSYLLNSINKDIFTTQEVLQENEVLETGIKLDATVALSEKINLQTGYHFLETGVANTQDVNLPRFRSYEKKVIQSHIAFGNIEYTPNGNRTVINAGFRLNYFPKFSEFLIEPRLNIHQKIGNGFAVEVLGEFKNQTTTHRIDFQSDFLGVEKRRWVLANEEDTPIIKSKQGSIGFLYNKKNWLLNLEGFYKKVEGITTSNQGFQNQFQFIKSTGSYQVKGVEFTLNKKINAFSAWLSYIYSKNDYTFNELSPSEFSNNLDIRHSVNLASSYNYRNLKVALGFNWHSGKPYTIPLKENEIIEIDSEKIINYDLPNTERLPDYLRANISAEYRWKFSDKIETKFNLALLNIFNNKNTLNIRYAIITDENGNSQVSKIEEFSLGFTPNLSIQVLF
ncbi:MAG: TonB-dependent receptor plug domain-containing protein [Flavobacteriaceae bacterium]